MLATITASLLSIMAGFTWKEVEACIVNGVHRIIIVTCILFLVGTLIGVWIQAGVILFLYWGLKLLSPSMFLVSTVLICAVFSLMTGTSFGTIGTAGLALLGVGEALGFPTGLTAGAIVSGAYFGDKMSPVSDTTNLASGITGTNIFSHIGSMLYTTVPATLVALGLYWYLGLNYSGGAMPDLTPITDALSANFNRSFLLALPPIVLVALAIRGIPPLPTLVIAILVGVVCAFVIQDGMTVKGMFKAATDGYVSQTGHPLVDKILSRGGLTSMSFVVFLLLIAMTLGGILEGTGALGVVVDRMTRSVTSPAGILATLVSCYLMTIGTGNGMLSIIVPARALKEVPRHGHPVAGPLRTLEDAVTLGIALVPYSMAAFFIVGVLKIDAMQYIPYAFVNWIVPIFSLTYGFTGFAIWKINKDAGNSPAESEA
ncbi:MAG: Na+/H+ antiporter NhaC family protein [Bilophila wadsworthia]